LLAQPPYAPINGFFFVFIHLIVRDHFTG